MSVICNLLSEMVRDTDWWVRGLRNKMAVVTCNRSSSSTIASFHAVMEVSVKDEAHITVGWTVLLVHTYTFLLYSLHHRVHQISIGQ